MRAEVITVGDELLAGEIVDTTSAWVSAWLGEIGVQVVRHTGVGDAVAELVEALRGAVTRADVVLVAGGLGPTTDDRTRQAVAELAGVELERSPELVVRLERLFADRSRTMPASNLVQADLPVGAQILQGTGTAAGFWLDVEGSLVCCVPGVPSEMRHMVAGEVVPLLVRRAGLAVTVTRAVRTAGLAEAAAGEAVADVVARVEAAPDGGPRIAFLASRAETRVQVTATAATRAGALALVDPVVGEVVERLGAAVTGLDGEGAEHAVARQMARLGWTLGVAESVTGGNLGARLVQVPGASAWFLGGVICYDAAVKRDLLGMDAAVLAREGPVSASAAAVIAAGVRRLLGSTVGVGVVGEAGPEAQSGRPVGTVLVGLALPPDVPPAPSREEVEVDGVLVREVALPARDRDEVQQWAASVALDLLRRRLSRV